MNKTVKIIALCLIGIIGLNSCISLTQEVLRYLDTMGGNYSRGDHSFLYTLCILMLSVSSFLFNLKTLRLRKVKIVAHNLLDTSGSVNEKTPINIFLWIGNFAFGICTSILGVYLLIFIQRFFPVTELPHGLFQHLISLSLVILGPYLIIDEWKMRKLATF